MPRLSIADSKALLRALEERGTPSSHALRAAARLRQRLEQAPLRSATSAPKSTPAPKTRVSNRSARRPCTLHVCTSCREPGSPREPRESRAGFQLYQALRATFRESPLRHHVEVRPAECLSLCPRPCGIALSSPGAWSYLFGDQQPGESAGEIMECASLYMGTPDGFMPRERRPNRLRASILGRVPPFDRGPKCT